MYEYLMKRKVIVLSANGVITDNVMLPVAEKPLQSVFALRQMQPCRVIVSLTHCIDWYIALNI